MIGHVVCIVRGKNTSGPLISIKKNIDPFNLFIIDQHKLLC